MSRLSSLAVRLAGAVALGLLAAGCVVGEEFSHGYVVDEQAIARVKPGTSAEEVLRVLGTPSTVSTVGNKSWYYISQSAHRYVAFLNQATNDQRVTAVYFTPSFKVERVALYGLQDGKVFDFISRTTPAGGAESNFASQLLRGLGTFQPPA